MPLAQKTIDLALLKNRRREHSVGDIGIITAWQVHNLHVSFEVEPSLNQQSLKRHNWSSICGNAQSPQRLYITTLRIEPQ